MLYRMQCIEWDAYNGCIEYDAYITMNRNDTNNTIRGMKCIEFNAQDALQRM